VYQSTGLADGSVIPPTIYKSDYYVNLFNQSTITPGYYLDNSGVQQALSSFCISDYIPVVAGQSYTVYAVDEGGNSPTFAGSYYNSSHAFLTPFTPGASPRTVTVPAGAAYVRINMGLSMIGSTYLKNTIPDRYFIDWLKIKTTNLENESVTLDKLSAAVKAEFGLSASQWAGKTANFLGDSITYGYGLADRVNDCFATLVKNSLSLATANNYGLIGTKIGKVVTGDGSFVERYSAMDAAADITFVIGGTNDYGHNASNHPYSLPFGTFTDRVETTFFGALHVLCNGLITKYPGKPIVFVTPTHRLSWDSVGDDYENNPDTGKNLRDYVNAIREVTEYYGVYVLDLFKSLNISPNVAVNKTSYMPDGLHPNEAGHVKMADAITHFTLNL
jgi:lysophospholipase L1-like esterase